MTPTDTAMTWHTLFNDFISEFKSSWPSHGLPDDLQQLSVLTDVRGEIVDLKACGPITDGVLKVYDTHQLVGPALAMLIQDCALLGEIVKPFTLGVVV